MALLLRDERVGGGGGEEEEEERCGVSGVVVVEQERWWWTTGDKVKWYILGVWEKSRCHVCNSVREDSRNQWMSDE